MHIDKLASTDFKNLDDLRVQAKTDAKGALPEVAKQFESVFLTAMLKSMRMQEHFLDPSSPFRSKSESQWQDVLDAQYASNIATQQSIGLADYLARHLENTTPDKVEPVPMEPLKMPASPIENTLTSLIEPIETRQSEKSSIDEFVKSIWPYARQAASTLGLDPKILVAQAVLETGWGQYVAKDGEGNSSHNLFNIKSGGKDGKNSVEIKTTEYIANTPISIRDSFRKYASVKESFDDYVSLIKGSDRYQDALKQVENPERFMQAIHRAGYATDPAYSSKILSIYRGEELQQAFARCGISE